MNLIIDFGNTQKKIAVFKNDILIELKTFKKISLDHLICFTKKYKYIDSVIISSVVDYPDSFDEYLRKKFFLIKFNSKIPVPVFNKYKSPDTLGNDRLAAVVGANHLFPNKNVLVIDAGTCIKYDFINSKNEYLGGSISPGISMRFKALHTFTDKLPLINMQEHEKLIGQNTKESILSGVLNGTISETDKIIEQYKKSFSSLKIIISGGDNIFLEKRLKNSTFANPNIVLIGLNKILEFNHKKF
jgi:type III pantothenate kinase